VAWCSREITSPSRGFGLPGRIPTVSHSYASCRSASEHSFPFQAYLHSLHQSHQDPCNQFPQPPLSSRAFERVSIQLSEAIALQLHLTSTHASFLDIRCDEGTPLRITRYQNLTSRIALPPDLTQVDDVSRLVTAHGLQACRSRDLEANLGWDSLFYEIKTFKLRFHQSDKIYCWCWCGWCTRPLVVCKRPQ